jgi:hypothetical protein
MPDVFFLNTNSVIAERFLDNSLSGIPQALAKANADIGFPIKMI